MATDIQPALGRTAAFLQAGPGASPGYDAIDLRRALSVGKQEGPLSSGSYKVSQRAAGANMSVDIAASTGDGALVQGDSVTGQGLYTVPFHTAVINEAITVAHATLPRLDQVILEVLDDTHAGGGSNKARVRVVDGTATSGATLENRNGAASLPGSALRLADVLVGAADSSITNAEIRDRRPGAPSIIATEESRTNTTYGVLATADQVSGIVLPTNGLIVVACVAEWKNTVAQAARAAIFLGNNQVKDRTGAVQEASGPSAVDTYSTFGSRPEGLGGGAGASPASPVTTGQTIGSTVGSGVCVLHAAAGTYDVSVRFSATSGSTTVKERKLWVWAEAR